MIPYLLGMTRFSGYAFYLLVVLYIGIAAYVLLGGWLRSANRQRFRLLWFLVLPTAMFVTFWFCGRGIWTILLWGFVFGDAGPYEEYGRWIAASVAILLSATVFVRLAWGFASRRFVRICLGGTISLAAVSGAMLVHEFASRIYGWTAHSAAENYLAKRRAVDPSAPRRIVAVDMPAWRHNPRSVRRFVLYSGDTPIQEVRVAPYGWWWWTLAGSGPAYITELDWAVDHWETDRDEAVERLNELIAKYPNIQASRMASRTLAWLSGTGGSELRRWKEEARRLHEKANRLKRAETRDR